MPSIASLGIQVTEVIEDSTRIRPWAGSTRSHGGGACCGDPTPCAGLSRGCYELSLVRWRRQKVSAPTTLAKPTAISDLFGRPPSVDGVARFALALAMRLVTCQTPQPRKALRRL